MLRHFAIIATLCCPLLLLSAAPSAIAAPVQVAAGRAAGAARRDGGAGLCLTAIRSGGFSSVDEAVLLLGRPPGGAVLDKTGGKVPAVNLRGGDPASVGDFSGEGASESPMPFTGAPGAMPPGDDRDLALRLRGYLSVPLPQTLTLGVFAGAPYRLRVGGVVVSESPAGALSSRVSQNVQFGGAGLYPIEILYAHKSGPAFLELSRGPGSAPASDNVELPFGGAFQIVQAAELFPSLSTAAAACAECDSDLDCPGSQSCRDGLCQDCSAPGACSGGGSGGG
ncbi:MAG: hypothetical protein K1X35_14895, partial [Caulobacteraceae bacterium]|nr:hypothetical protein [Caulobacteraceae bacterium]